MRVNNPALQRVMKFHAPSKSRHAFTLIEIVFATMAFAVILLVMKMTLAGALSMRKRIDSRMDWENHNTIALSILKKDLENIILTGGSHAGEIYSDNSSNSGQIEFFTTSGNISDSLPWGDIQKVRYFLGNSIMSQFGMNTSTNLGQSLLREVTRNVAAQIQNNPETMELMGRVDSLTFQFFNGVTWTPTWDSTTSDPAIPLAIRATLAVHMDTSTQNNRILGTREIVVPVFVVKPEDSSSTNATDSATPPTGQSAGL
jgi:type II secretory pathway component PulJ